MGKISWSDVLELSVSERIQLVEDIWDSIATGSDPGPLTEAQRRELDRRLEAHRKNPISGSSWADVKKRIGASE
jgi:putative addiction module component (TIGR02574 family)